MKKIDSKIEIDREIKLLEKAKKNPKHFEYFYNQYYESVFRFIYLRMDSKDSTVDLTQQTFIKALKNLKQFEFKGFSILSWFTRIAINEINQYYRTQKKRRVINITSVIENTLLEELESDHSILRKEELNNYLKQLTKNEFSLIEMRFFEEKSFKIIGAILDITENNAKVKTYRAIEKLRMLFTKKTTV